MIEELSQGITEQAKKLTHYMRKSNTLEHQFQDFINEFKRWWDNSVLTDPEVHKYIGDFPPYYRMATPGNLRPYDTAHINMHSVVELKAQTLEALHIAVERDLGRRHMHILLQTGIHSYKYYIDERALYSFEGMPEKMIEYAWKEIIYAFKEKFKNADTKRNS